MKVQFSNMTVSRDETRNATVLTITLNDSDLNRHHLVRPDTTVPVDALAQYALHCLTVMHHETVDEKWRRILKDMDEGRSVPDTHNKGERAA